MRLPRPTTRRLMAAVAVAGLVLGIVSWSKRERQRRAGLLAQARRYDKSAQILREAAGRIPRDRRVRVTTLRLAGDRYTVMYGPRGGDVGLTNVETTAVFYRHASAYERLAEGYRLTATYPWGATYRLGPPPPPFRYEAGRLPVPPDPPPPE